MFWTFVQREWDNCLPSSSLPPFLATKQVSNSSQAISEMCHVKGHELTSSDYHKPDILDPLHGNYWLLTEYYLILLDCEKAQKILISELKIFLQFNHTLHVPWLLPLTVMLMSALRLYYKSSRNSLWKVSLVLTHLLSEGKVLPRICHSHVCRGGSGELPPGKHFCEE